VCMHEILQKVCASQIAAPCTCSISPTPPSLSVILMPHFGNHTQMCAILVTSPPPRYPAGPKAAVARKPTVEVKAFEAAETDEQIADRCMH
jgi:hypothetical protein